MDHGIYTTQTTNNNNFFGMETKTGMDTLAQKI